MDQVEQNTISSPRRVRKNYVLFNVNIFYMGRGQELFSIKFKNKIFDLK